MDFVRKGKNNDEQLGAIALHVAMMVQYRLYRGPNKGRTFHRAETVRKDTLWFIDVLPQLYPEAAQASLSNGRLPLHWALESGKTWGEKDYLAIRKLVESYPNGVTVVDPVTGLAPFMMAAAAACKDPESSVETTFMLLRLDPAQVLGYATTAWTQESSDDLKPKAPKKRKRAKKKGW